MSSISLEELHLYHSVDREIFSRLLVKLSRDPAESLLVMSLWLWLEENGYANIVFGMMRLSDHLLNALANEAVLCLTFLNYSNHAATGPGPGLPVTSAALGREISLKVFVQCRFRAISGVKFFLNNVCARIFTDILQLVLARSSNQGEENDGMRIPGFPHPVFGGITIVHRPLDHNFPTGGLWGWPTADGGMSEDDRTLFLTFSRGFPVTEEEVKETFTEAFGECVENIQMEEVAENEQPLYAKVVMNSVAALDRILDGKRIAKFRVNGKHIWARKYERREGI